MNNNKEILSETFPEVTGEPHSDPKVTGENATFSILETNAKRMADLMEAIVSGKIPENRIIEAIDTLREATRANRALVGVVAEKYEARQGEVEKFKKLSLIDSLTGISNRGYFDERLEETVASVQRDQTSLEDQSTEGSYTLVMIDLAGLKAINDKIAPAAGDAAIKASAEILASFARKGEVAARIGGDEFALIARNTGEGMLERLNKHVEQESFEYKGTHYPLTMYIAATPIDGHTDAQSVFELAGDKLNKQKAFAKHYRESVDLTPINYA